MRKDWDRSELCFSDGSSFTSSITENMYGGTYMDSPFAKISKDEEVTYFSENIKVENQIVLIDDHSKYLQDGEFVKTETGRVLTSIICREYEREFYDWMDRGFRLWVLYPAAVKQSQIVQLWAQEIELIRKEFKERTEAVMPF